MRHFLIVLLGGAICTPVMAQAIIDPAPPTTITLYCWGTVPVATTVRTELLTTVPGGGAPVAASEFDTVVPAGPAATWCAPLLAAIAADPAVVAGAVTSGPGTNMVNMPLNSAAGARFAMRMISTTAPPLPVAPAATMPPLLGLATPWPAAPLQLVAAAGSRSYAALDLIGPAAPIAVGIMGTHFLAVPPLRSTEIITDRPTLSFDQPIPVPTVSEWGLVVLTLLCMVMGTVALAWRRGGATEVA